MTMGTDVGHDADEEEADEEEQHALPPGLLAAAGIVTRRDQGGGATPFSSAKTMRRALQQVLAHGAARVLRQHGFARPGGGRRFVRTRGLVEQSISVSSIARGAPGQLRFHLSQAVGYVELWRRHEMPWFDVDPGVPGGVESAVSEVAAWLEEAVQLFEPALALGALARRYEARMTTGHHEAGVRLSAALWRRIGREAEASRVFCEQARYAKSHPPPPPDDVPF